MIRRTTWRRLARRLRIFIRLALIASALALVAVIAGKGVLLARIRAWRSDPPLPYPLQRDNVSHGGKYAYATLLCDDVMTDAIKVLIYSLKKTTDYPFLVLVLPGVKERQELLKLGAEIHEISMLDYPFRVTAEKAAINKMCRYSKLHIWRFVQYEKIIFIDVDCLVVKSLDPAFKWPEFSAVRDAGDTFNTGLFVLEPSLATWEAMKDSYLAAPSYNQGDQGFINWYFRNASKTALPVSYNTVCKHKSHAVWPLMRRQAKMIHYTSETKPWNFFAASHKFWRQNFDAAVYYRWARTFREVSQRLRIDVYDPKRSMWLNARRSAEICERFFPAVEGRDVQGGRRMLVDKISVVFTKWRSIKYLLAAINHYRFTLSSLVHRIFISWNPSLGVPGIELTRFKFIQEEPRVELITHRYESVNNIWNPIPNLATAAVFLADDEHLPDLEKLEITLEAWKDNRHSLVGFFARYHTRQRLVDGQGGMGDLSPSGGAPDADLQQNPLNATESLEAAAAPSAVPMIISPAGPVNIADDQHLWIYNITGPRRPRPYSLLSSQLLLLSSDHLFTYTCLLPERIHREIDEMPDDAADLAMNLMVAGMTGSRPILVKSDFIDPEAGRFAGESWALTRGQQLKDLVRLFTLGQRDPLQLNSIIVTQFNKIPFKKRSIKQWNKP